MEEPDNPLMSFRIRRILMICSNYDAFILREDGRIESQVQAEYIDLNLSDPPKFVWTTSASEAAAVMGGGKRIDMIICMYNENDKDVFSFASSLKAAGNRVPVVLLTHFSKEMYRRLSAEDTSGIDFMFSWHGSADLILAIVKLFEDRMNADNDILVRGVQALLLVEDSVRYYSTYLPELYRLVLTQTNEFLSETLNDEQRKQRKHYRPKVLLATNYSDAVSIYRRYSANIMGVISDIGMVEHQGDSPENELADAGIRLVKLIRKDDKYMPVLLQSSQGSMEAEAAKLDVGFVRKYSKTLFIRLGEYIREEFGFGDFVFRGPGGQEYGRAATLAQLERVLPDIPDNVLLATISKNKFSKWFLARGLFSLGTEFRQVHHINAADARAFFMDRIYRFQQGAGRGVIARFDSSDYERYIWFSRMGEGSLGGKARGLAFLNNLVQKHDLRHRWDGITVSVPRTVVVATDYFDQFVLENGLQYVIDNPDLSDDDILSEFVASHLPSTLVQELKAYLATVDLPLAVRSSSKLEDSNFQPFAGVYSTYMVPLVENRDQMLRLLEKAIKSVYASVFYAGSRNYIQTTENLLSEEKMAVVIQDICGSSHGDVFYPMMSGVARSVNFYPIGSEKPSDGTLELAYGLGKTVVDGENILRVNPRKPRKILQLSDPGMALRDTQKTIYALDMNPASFKISRNEGINLRKIPVADALQDYPFPQFVVSTFDPANARIVPGVASPGPRIVSFDYILKYGKYPLCDAINGILEICKSELKDDVEMEFAMDILPESGKALLKLLQVRPVTGYVTTTNDSFDDVLAKVEKPVIVSGKALGAGYFTEMKDIVYIDPQCFDKSRTREIAAEVAMINAAMKAAGKQYLLAGPGRWGSSDPWLGVPVMWSDISEARLIVEYALEGFRIEPSQGTHFFHNITSLGVGYLNVNDLLMASDRIDFEVLSSLAEDTGISVPDAVRTGMVKTVLAPEGMVAFIDRNQGKAVIGI